MYPQQLRYLYMLHLSDKVWQTWGCTEEFAGDHLQLIFCQPPFGGSEELPAQHVCKLRPGGGGTVGEEHNVLGKQTLSAQVQKAVKAACCSEGGRTLVSWLIMLNQRMEAQALCCWLELEIMTTGREEA